MYSRKRRQYSLGRPHKRVPMPSHPLPRSLGARPAGAAFVPAAPDSDSPPVHRRHAEREASSRSHSLRALALFIIAIVPVSVGIWGLSIVVPVAIEAREAMGEVFVTQVDRPHLDGLQPSPPALPSSVAGASSSTPQATTVPGTMGSLTPIPAPGATETPVGPAATPYPEWDGNDPIHILLLGVDSRPDDKDPPRSDTIIVVRVDPGAQRVDMFSVPRDLLVEIPGYRAHKINAAYVIGENDDLPGGGAVLAAQTIEYNFGIRIDYWATVNVLGMQRIVDEIGGIVVDVKAPIKDDQYPTEDYRYTRAYFPTGPQELDGVQAVRYARTRHDDNDFKRSERQQEVLLAIRNQVLVSGVITKLPQLISEVGDSVRTDLSPGQVLSLARLGQDLPREQIYSHSINALVEEQYIDGEFFFIADWYSVRELVQNLPGDSDATTNPDEVPDPDELSNPDQLPDPEEVPDPGELATPDETFDPDAPVPADETTDPGLTADPEEIIEPDEGTTSDPEGVEDDALP